MCGRDKLKMLWTDSDEILGSTVELAVEGMGPIGSNFGLISVAVPFELE